MHVQHIKTTQSTGTAARGFWLVRWLLVLVLMWDQVGSPLHQHHHDSGIDAQWLSAPLPGSHLALPHAAGGHDDPRISHAVLAVRSQLDLSSFALGDDPSDSFIHSRAVSLMSLDPLGPAIASGELTAPHRTYRSLPPAGRAPPLHT